MDRDSSIDKLKGILIFLVVLGHVIGAGSHICAPCDQWFYRLTYKIIYAFHMPAFFFVAGVLYKEHIDVVAFMQKRFVRLLVPYFLFGIAFIVLFSLFAKGLAPSTAHYATRQGSPIVALLLELLYGGSYSGRPAFAYNSVLWFLPTLFSLEVLYCVLNGLRIKARRISVFVFDMSLFVFCFELTWLFRTCPLPSLPYGISLVPYYMLFYILGKSHPIKRLLAWFNSRLLGLFVAGTLLTGLSVACYFMPEHHFACLSLKWCFLFFLIAVAGVFGITLVSPYLRLRFWSFIGSSTMCIMLLHKPIVVGLQFVVMPIRRLYGINLVTGLIVSLIITLVAIFVCTAANSLIKKYCPMIIGEKGARNNDTR